MNGMETEGTGGVARCIGACSTGLQKCLAARLNALADVNRNQRTAREVPLEMLLHDCPQGFSFMEQGASTILTGVDR